MGRLKGSVQLSDWKTAAEKGGERVKERWKFGPRGGVGWGGVVQHRLILGTCPRPSPHYLPFQLFI